MTPDQILDLIQVSGLLRAVLLITLTWGAGLVLGSLTARAASAFPSRRLEVEQLASLVRFTVYVSGTVLALFSIFTLSKEVLTVLGGTIVVTVGLLLKDQASAILAGVLILVERPFQVGDRIAFAGYYGEVKSIGLRAVRLITLDDNEITIPNSKFLSDPVASGNSGAFDMLVQMDFHIGADQNITEAKRIVEAHLTASRYFYPQKPWAVLVSQVILQDVVAIRVRAKAYVLELRYEKAFESDVTQRVMETFQAEDILPPAMLYRPRTPPAGSTETAATASPEPSEP